MATHGHSSADARNLQLHRAAFEKLRANPALKARVLELTERWLSSKDHECSRPWLEAWREMLTSWDLGSLEREVLQPEHGQILRQCSPLAPVLTPRERWAVLREVNERLAAEERGAVP